MRKKKGNMQTYLVTTKTEQRTRTWPKPLILTVGLFTISVTLELLPLKTITKQAGTCHNPEREITQSLVDMDPVELVLPWVPSARLATGRWLPPLPGNPSQPVSASSLLLQSSGPTSLFGTCLCFGTEAAQAKTEAEPVKLHRCLQPLSWQSRYCTWLNWLLSSGEDFTCGSHGLRQV